VAGINGSQCRSALIDVKIAGKPYHALADARATVTLMRSDIAKRLSLPLCSGTITSNGVNSSKLHIIGRTAAEITIG